MGEGAVIVISVLSSTISTPRLIAFSVGLKVEVCNQLHVEHGDVQRRCIGAAVAVVHLYREDIGARIGLGRGAGQHAVG